MTKVRVRKIATYVEEIRHDGGPPLETPARKGWVAAVIANPFAGRYEPELQWFMDELKPLGLECSTLLCRKLGIEPAQVEAYGKGSIVGVAGEVNGRLTAICVVGPTHRIDKHAERYADTLLQVKRETF